MCICFIKLIIYEIFLFFLISIHIYTYLSSSITVLISLSILPLFRDTNSTETDHLNGRFKSEEHLITHYPMKI